MGKHRPKSERVKNEFNKILNLGAAVLDKLSPEQRQALQALQGVANVVAEAAENGAVKNLSGDHPVVASLREDLKIARRDERKLNTRLGRLEEIREEISILEQNDEYCRTMIPWLENQIETALARISDGKEPEVGSRPNIERFDTEAAMSDLAARRKMAREAEKAARKADTESQNESDNDDDSDSDTDSD